MLLDVDAVAVPVADGSATELALLRWWIGGSDAELRQRQAHLGGLVAHRQERSDHLDPLEVGHRGQERRNHLIATGCAAASARPRRVADADARHAVAEFQERTAGRTPAARVEEDISQRPIDARADVCRMQPVECEDVTHQRIRRRRARRPSHHRIRGAPAPTW